MSIVRRMYAFVRGKKMELLIVKPNVSIDVNYSLRSKRKKGSEERERQKNEQRIITDASQKKQNKAIQQRQMARNDCVYTSNVFNVSSFFLSLHLSSKKNMIDRKRI